MIQTGQACGTTDERLRLIAKITASLTGSASLYDQIAEAADLARDAFGADSCIVRRLDGNDLVLLGSSGLPLERRRPRIAAGWGIAEESFKTLQPLIITNVRENPLTASIVNTLPNAYLFGAYAGAPLIVEGKPAGILGLYFSNPIDANRSFDLDLLQTIANTIAFAVVKNRLEGEVKAGEDALESQLNERRVLEVELIHSQKMESIGRLAGEVAHNVNNMLTVMAGFSELAKDELSNDHPVQQHLDKILVACMRTGSLTRQMLMFARKEIIAPAPIRMQPLLRAAAQMLVPLLGPRIALEIEVFTKVDTVFADPGQIEHVLVNLMVNARDAMCGMGTLTVRLDHRALTDEDCASHPDLTPGEYVCLEISDTGSGMTEEIRKRIFEPFFTTKVQGKGTGLGLATCYAAIKQNHGDIEVESAPGQGALFRILLPVAPAASEAPALAYAEAKVSSGAETVLLVDSERAVREVAEQSLTRYGYSVFTAASGREAFELAVLFGGQFSILVTETLLSDMSGPELAHRIQALYPHVREVFTSGCFESDVTEDNSSQDHHALLRKPFTPDQIARKLRSILDAGN